jgi:hypothetical protein
MLQGTKKFSKGSRLRQRCESAVMLGSLYEEANCCSELATGAPEMPSLGGRCMGGACCSWPPHASITCLAQPCGSMCLACFDLQVFVSILGAKASPMLGDQVKSYVMVGTQANCQSCIQLRETQQC